MNITTVGPDLAKNVFHVVCLNEHNKEVKKSMLRRNQIGQFFAQLPPCQFAMEACAITAIQHQEVAVRGLDSFAQYKS